MLDRHRVARLAFPRHGAGDTDGLFQAGHLIKAILGGFTDNAVSVPIHFNLLTHGAPFRALSSSPLSRV
jgi:hypothetical protein